MTQKHDDAFVALIRADANLASCVFDTVLVGPDGKPLATVPEKYVVVESNRGLVRPDRFTGPARRRQITYWVRSIGLTKGQSAGVADRVLSLVLDRRLTVNGWICDPIQHAASQPVQTDESVKPIRFFGVDQFDLFTSPAPST